MQGEIFIVGTALIGIGALAYFVFNRGENTLKNPLDFQGFSSNDTFYDGLTEPVYDWDFGLETTRAPASNWIMNFFGNNTTNIGSGNKPEFIDLAQPLMQLIGQKESNNNYNAVYKNAATLNLIGMTIQEVREFQDYMVRDLKLGSSAVGKYQFIRKTLDGLVSRLNLSQKQIFNPDIQDRFCYELLKQRGFESFATGKMNINTFAKNVSMEWASFPKDNTNLSYYDGDGLNKALITYPEVIAVLNQILNKARNAGVMA